MTKWLVVGALLLSPLAYAKKKECTVATEGESPMAKACREGGRDAAKKKMKELVGRANKNGGDFKCGRCHEDTKSFKLKDNAPDDLKKLLETAGGG